MSLVESCTQVGQQGLQHLLPRLLTVEADDLVAYFAGLKDASSNASSWAALRRKSSACSRRFIQDLPLGGSFVVDVAGSVPPILKVIVTDNQEIDGHVEGTKEAVQTDDLGKAWAAWTRTPVTFETICLVSGLKANATPTTSLPHEVAGRE